MRTVICYEDNFKGFASFEVKEGFSAGEVEALAHELYGQRFNQFVVLKNGSTHPEIVGQWRREKPAHEFLDELNAMPPSNLFGDGPCAIVEVP